MADRSDTLLAVHTLSVAYRAGAVTVFAFNIASDSNIAEVAFVGGGDGGHFFVLISLYVYRLALGTDT